MELKLNAIQVLRSNHAVASGRYSFGNPYYNGTDCDEDFTYYELSGLTHNGSIQQTFKSKEELSLFIHHVIGALL